MQAGSSKVRSSYIIFHSCHTTLKIICNRDRLASVPLLLPLPRQLVRSLSCIFQSSFTTSYTHARSVQPHSSVRGPLNLILSCAVRATSFFRARTAHPCSSLCAVTRLSSQNCTVPLISLYIGNASSLPLSQEIVDPLPIPVPTPPPAQVPRPTPPTPPGADVATQRADTAQAAEDEDFPMSSLMAHRASSPRLQDVASSQDIQGADAVGEVESSTGGNKRRARKQSGPDGTSSRICTYPSPLHLIPASSLPSLCISFHPLPVPTLPDSTDYDEFAAPIRAGPSHFHFLLFQSSFAHVVLEDLPPKMPGDVVHPPKLSAADADRSASLFLIPTFFHSSLSLPMKLLGSVAARSLLVSSYSPSSVFPCLIRLQIFSR